MWKKVYSPSFFSLVLWKACRRQWIGDDILCFEQKIKPFSRYGST